MTFTADEESLLCRIVASVFHQELFLLSIYQRPQQRKDSEEGTQPCRKYGDLRQRGSSTGLFCYGLSHLNL